MCILIFKPKNVAFPDIEAIRESWRSNPHGAGIAWSDGQKTHLKKGFMTLDHLELFLEQKAYELQSYDVILHFRFATLGSVKAQNTHPFVVSDRIKDLQRLKYHGSDMIIAHNGIVSGKAYNVKTKNDLSDTMIFTKRLHTLGIESNEIQNILKAGKFALMYPDHVDLFGQFIEDSGVFYSNTSYKVFNLSYTYDYDDWCYKEEECLKSGICYYSEGKIENEALYGDPEFCPLASDYLDICGKNERKKASFSCWDDLYRC